MGRKITIYLIIFLQLLVTSFIPSFIRDEFETGMFGNWILIYLFIIIIYGLVFLLIDKIKESSLNFIFFYNLIVCVLIQVMYYLGDLGGLNFKDDLLNLGKYILFLFIYLNIVIYDKYRYRLLFLGLILGFLFGLLFLGLVSGVLFGILLIPIGIIIIQIISIFVFLAIEYYIDYKFKK